VCVKNYLINTTEYELTHEVYKSIAYVAHSRDKLMLWHVYTYSTICSLSYIHHTTCIIHHISAKQSLSRPQIPKEKAIQNIVMSTILKP